MMSAPRDLTRAPNAVRVVALFAIACVLAACGSDDKAAPPATPATITPAGSLQTATGETSRPPTDGALVFGTTGGIAEFDLRTGEQRLLIEPPSNADTLSDPVVSPDGARIAYVVHGPVRTTDRKRDITSDIWIAARDGSNPRLLFAHSTINETVEYPQWAGDDRVFALRTRLQGSDLSTAKYMLLRIDVATGASAEFLPGVARFGISADGATLTYARYVTDGQNLMITPLSDTSNPVVLLAPDQPLDFFGTPKLSPDGNVVAFTAYDRVKTKAGLSHDENPPGLWTISAGGGTPTLLTDIDTEWQGSLAWSDDGARIYVAQHEELTEIDAVTGEGATVVRMIHRTEISWVPSPAP